VRRAYAVASSPANASATAYGLPNWLIAAAAAWSGGSPIAVRSSVACSRPSRSSVRIASWRPRGPCSCAARSESTPQAGPSGAYRCWSLGGRWPCSSLEEGSDGGGELVPDGPLLAERDVSGRSELVGAAPASADRLPVTRD
jgi:hypothetical protein